ncbi:MAG: hypothetical protein D6689_09910 [Deltaproteobacteria bacterium]|nr:MAG: hypothetical protein D6689_09910 [Deltaproteobacteria bacterium]
MDVAADPFESKIAFLYERTGDLAVMNPSLADASPKFPRPFFTMPLVSWKWPLKEASTSGAPQVSEQAGAGPPPPVVLGQAPPPPGLSQLAGAASTSFSSTIPCESTATRQGNGLTAASNFHFPRPSTVTVAISAHEFALRMITVSPGVPLPSTFSLPFFCSALVSSNAPPPPPPPPSLNEPSKVSMDAHSANSAWPLSTNAAILSTTALMVGSLVSPTQCGAHSVW